MALVVTIVVLLILAGITITYVMGKNSIFKQAQETKTQTEIAKLRERIEFIQIDWWTDKKLDPTITLGDFWNRLIDENIIGSIEDIEGPEKEGENDVYLLDTTEGYLVEVIITTDGSIIIGEIGKGDSLPPKVQSIQVTNKNSNQIEIKVVVSRLEDGKLSYYYKKSEETNYHELTGKQNTKDLTATYTGLEQNQIYNIKVVAENKKGKGERTINVLTGELEVGVISQKGETTWTNNKASIELETTNTNLTLKYQVGGVEDDKWLPYHGPIGSLNHNDTVYAVLTDGTNYGETASIVVRDGRNPVATISNLTTSANPGANITATVTHQDNESGVKIVECKWIFTTSPTANVGTIASSYTGTFSSNDENITWSTTTAGTYYLHVLTVDNAGNKKETVSEASITVNQLAMEITVSPKTVSIDEGTTQQLTAAVTPTNTTNKSVTWSSDTPSVATVSSTGLVTGVKAGTAIITVKTEDGSDKTVACSVTVIDSTPVVITSDDTGWATMNRIAKAIANDSSITSSSTKATGTTENGVRYEISVGEIYKVKYLTMEKRVRLLGFKHDDLVNTGVYGGNHSKASISFEFFDSLAGTGIRYMNNDDYNTLGWRATYLRKDLNGYSDTNSVQSGPIGGAGANLSNKSYIKQVKKKYIATYNSAESVTTCNDYLWLLACSEIVPQNSDSTRFGTAITSEGSQYKYYQGVTEDYSSYSPNRAKAIPGNFGFSFLRSPCYYSNKKFAMVFYSGQVSDREASESSFVLPGFCI